MGLHIGNIICVETHLCIRRVSMNLWCGRQALTSVICDSKNEIFRLSSSGRLSVRLLGIRIFDHPTPKPFSTNRKSTMDHGQPMNEETERKIDHHDDSLLFTQESSPRSLDGDEHDGSHDHDAVLNIPLLSPSAAATDTDTPFPTHQNRPTESDFLNDKELSLFGICNINDVDDDSSQSSVSSSHNPIGESGMTLTERRAFNIQRNNELLSRLGMMKNHYLSPLKSVAQHGDSALDIVNSPASVEHRRGMIIPTCLSSIERHQGQCSPKVLSSSLKELYDQYPHRSTQIRKLFCLLSAPIMTSSDRFVPPPIFVTGPAGSGKTMIVRDVVQLCCNIDCDSFRIQTSSKCATKQRIVLNAYIDCATLDSINVDEFFSSAFSQWRSQIPASTTVEPVHSQCPQQLESSTNTLAKSSGITNKTKSANLPCVSSQLNPSSPDHKKALRKRRTKSVSRKTSSVLNKNLLDLNSSIDAASEQHLHSSQNIMLTAVWTFGRSLQIMLDKLKRDSSADLSVVMIVDHAELLLSLETSHSRTLSGDRINLLAQLLMLPETYGFNLIIIAISKNSLLEHTGTLRQAYRQEFCFSKFISLWSFFRRQLSIM